ncbi:MAG: Na+/H+ antiporter NhaC family protein [Clostridium sp.]|uniref:Na+/H+ antiporter NhaC family protein n=1 Tax=Clostridium culturomicium TaxID=1499683 RepID=UPI00058F43F7|nr:Na+/H+ antiporter NhaC family protein [Clostridium culturomicium]MDU4891275.1 Na+/H+ antiporter NhaC family protein [Clostridium sp.]MDU7085165.1 Na+/H+ antiporter NhaC family protein [Clostridium sp.]
MSFFKGFLKFVPIFILAGLIMMDMNVLIAAPIATLVAFVIASLTEKLTFNDLMDAATDNVKELILVFFILMFAYAMANAFMATGVGASIVNIALSIGVNARTVAVCGFLVTGILSVATGTSWGTFAACAPIFLWLNHILGGNILLTAASIAGGACFGDNIGLISDTTVVSSGIQKVEVLDRVKSQVVWSVGCLAVSAIIIYGISVSMNLPTQVTDTALAIDAIPSEAWSALEAERPAAVELLNQVKEGVPFYMVLPLVLVIGCAVSGLPTLVCLFVGLASSFIFGSFAGTISGLGAFLSLTEDGFSEAGSWVIVMMMWFGAFGGIMSRMNAFEPLSNFVLKISKNVRQLMFWNGLLSIGGNAALSDEMAQIVTIGPIIKELVDKNVEGSDEDLTKLRIRNATFSSALGVFGSQLIPWHVYMGFYIGILSSVYPLYEFATLDIIKFNVMAFVTVGSLLILTLTGWDRFIPNFGLPREPKVKLKKDLQVKKECTESQEIA